MAAQRLPDETIASLKELHKFVDDKKLSYRINAVILMGKGFTAEEVAENLLISERQIWRYWDTYNESGTEGLLDKKHKGSQKKLNDDQLEILQIKLNNYLFATAKEVVAWVEGAFKISYTPEGMVILLHRLGYSYKKTKLVPTKADPQAQAEFVEKYDELSENLEEDEALYFVDGVHPTHNVNPGRAWVKTGEEAIVDCNTGRKRININGAISAVDHDFHYVESDSVNSQSTIELYKKLEANNPNAKTIYVIRDNARYYLSNLVKEYLKSSRIVEIPLPSYSPNLNLIERVWKLFKREITTNRYHGTFEQFRGAVIRFLDNISDYSTELKNLVNGNFHLWQDI